MSIKLLSKDTAEKIAAGEVIENPASVIKELVENALDAGAGKIEVLITGGGRELIIVTDDGEGIRQDEVALAFQRFATSKLAVIDDLDQLASLGFRGEALPSIATVSKLEMITRPKVAIGAARIVLEGGVVTQFEETGAPHGTKVIVRDLFYNTPGRKKFLRAPTVETSRISSLLTAMALAHPDRSFSFRSNGRSLLKTTGDGKLLHVFGFLYGYDIASAMLELNAGLLTGEKGIMVSGCISAPYCNRSSRKWITVIVNGRVVNNPQLVSALIRAYGEQLPQKRFPLAVINLRVSPGLIDVNVHPAKTEIRFLDTESAKRTVYNAVKISLQNLSNSPEWPENRFLTPQRKPTERYSQPGVDLQNSNLWQNPNAESVPMVQESKQPLHDFLEQGWKGYPIISDTECRGLDSGATCKAETARYTLIGQYLNSYIIVQQGEDLILIDQHAAHERLIYNRLKDTLINALQADALQLTIPYTLNIPVFWREQLPGLLPCLKSCGIDLEPVDHDCYAVRAVPLIFNEPLRDYEIVDLLEKLINGEEREEVNRHDALLKTVACHRSVKAMQLLKREEMTALLDEWFETDAAGYCPHGRPILIRFERRQLEKSFLRRSSFTND